MNAAGNGTDPGAPARHRASLEALLEAVAAGDASVAEALGRLKTWPYEDVGFARLDHHRSLRTGFPEVVFCPGKTPDQVAEALARLADAHGTALATRADREHAAAAVARIADVRHDPVSRTLVVDRTGAAKRPGVVVISAGTSDLPVAGEAAVTAELVGSAVTRLDDCGVAGVHRLLDVLDELTAARAIVAVAGMEGALPGVIAGLVEAPVIAVPTSVGYGAHLGGLAPLLTMLNSCAPGLAVVNIDNGFAAGYLAAMINRQAGAAC